MFEHAVRRNRLAHAYLFAGPAGVGKRLFAQELAKALLCEATPAGRLEACDRCPACLQVEAGTHPDCFQAGRPEERQELPIDTIRELCGRFALKSARGRGKVAILDDADDLNEEAANCFLKTLEEPPPRSVLILVGSSPERQLPTIVSRCQVVRFAPLPEALVAEVLRGQELPEPALIDRLARLSGGSPGQALALADPALWEFRRGLLEGVARPRPDGVALARSLTRFVEEAGKEAAAQRRRAALVLRLLVEFFDDVLRLRVGGTPRLAEGDDRRALQPLAERLEPEQLLAVLERCLEGDAQVDRRVQLVLALEALLDALGQQLKC
jgi:DNA polymerase-3 subunit delta'